MRASQHLGTAGKPAIAIRLLCPERNTLRLTEDAAQGQPWAELADLADSLR